MIVKLSYKHLHLTGETGDIFNIKNFHGTNHRGSFFLGTEGSGTSVPHYRPPPSPAPSPQKSSMHLHRADTWNLSILNYYFFSELLAYDEPYALLFNSTSVKISSKSTAYPL